MEEAPVPKVVTEEVYQKLVTKYNTLYRRHRDLEDLLHEQRDFVIKAEEKYQAAKKNAKQWSAWIDSHRCSCSELDSSRPKQPVTTLDKPLNDSGGVQRTEVVESAHTNSIEQLPSSQTTEADGGSTPIANLGIESDDEPQVVSIRSLKRKRADSAQRMPPPTRIKQEPTSPDDPIRLDSEGYSSPVLKSTRPMRTETSDLDALVQHMHTPRKHRRIRAVSNEPVRPPKLPPALSSLSEGDIAEETDGDMHVKVESRKYHQHREGQVTARDFALQPASKAATHDALRQISHNITAVVNNARNSMNTKRKRAHQREPFQFGLLSEDGDDQTSQAVGAVENHAPQIYVSHRLDTLLDVPSPGRLPLKRRRTPERAVAQRREPKPKEPEYIKAETIDVVPKPVFRRPRGLEISPPPLQPEDEPLRLRPRQLLRLEDFRINPKYMGENYAFADTFRGREQRRCLQGCTRPDCCGDAFRKAVELGAVKNTKGDSQLLEEYLGPDFASLMGAFAPDKRNDILAQARAHSFANQHGKHRHAFERRSTPPGFWRTDMPSTQEEQQDRAKAEEMEMAKVEDRWREAMRDGGRWKFRDE